MFLIHLHFQHVVICLFRMDCEFHIFHVLCYPNPKVTVRIKAKTLLIWKVFLVIWGKKGSFCCHFAACSLWHWFSPPRIRWTNNDFITTLPCFSCSSVHCSSRLRSCVSYDEVTQRVFRPRAVTAGSSRVREKKERKRKEEERNGWEDCGEICHPGD